MPAPSALTKDPHAGAAQPLEKADVVVMGSIELSNFDQKVHLGSMAQAVAKQSSAHIMIVKNYAST